MNLVLALVFMCVTAEGLEEPRLVYPRLLEERSSDGKLVLHVHDELTLNLEQASVAAPQLRFIDERDGFSVTEMVDGKEINSNLYQDRDQLATVEVKLTEGNAEISYGESLEVISKLNYLDPLVTPFGKHESERGIVGPNHRIEPVLTTERSESGLIPHMVHEIQHAKVRDQAISFVEKAKRFHLTARNYHTEDKVPEEVIVEAFFVADRSYYSTFKGNREALVYVCMLLNSVNLRMTDMKNPRVRIALTGLESAAQHEYLQGVSKNMHDNAALRAFQKYGERKKNDFGNPDIVFLLSWTEGTQGSDGKWRSRATGIAYVSGVCTRFYVGLGEDAPGVFTGVHTVTHEIGHLLVSEHDETGPSSFVPGHPGAKACRWSDGYIMSYVDKDANHHKFSRCSLDQMRHVLRVRGKACWEVLSRLENVTNKYPGYRNVTRKICMRAFPKKPNVQAELIYPRGDECKLQCRYWEQIGYFTRYHRTFRDVPDFTPCGHNRVCVRGRCVPGTIPRKN